MAGSFCDRDFIQSAIRHPESPSPWFKQRRKCADGSERDFLCSLPPGGEKLTGTLRSKPFDLPQKLSFWIAGHRGPLASQAHEKNFVRLVEAASGIEIAKTFPPRSDVAKNVTWDLSQSKSKCVLIEITDGDNGSAYAWLAAGGFSPEVVSISDLNGSADDKRVRALSSLAPMVGSGEAFTLLEHLPHKAAFSADTREALARALNVRSETILFAPFTDMARDAELAPLVFAVLESRDGSENLLRDFFKAAPQRSQLKLASALAGNTQSAYRFLLLAPPRVLADPLITGKVKALGDATLTKQLGELTAKLPPQSDALNKLIAARLKSFDRAKVDVKKGEIIFTATCTICHRIGVRGNLVGPQLDGIGARGAERLLEDILDPSRAVDPAFRLHFVKQKNGELLGGILRREDGDSLVFADAAAQEHSVPKAQIVEDQVSEFSLMPAGFGDVFSEEQLHDLIAYLLERK